MGRAPFALRVTDSLRAKIVELGEMGGVFPKLIV